VANALVNVSDARRADAFVARVAALTPAEWGRLDACGDRLSGSSVFARWERARVQGALLRIGRQKEGAPAGDVHVLELVVKTLAWMFGEGDARAVHRMPPLPDSAPPQARGLIDRFLAIRDLSARQPGGAEGNAPACLHYALLALTYRAMLPPASFNQLYGPVEPVIPFASL